MATVADFRTFRKSGSAAPLSSLLPNLKRKSRHELAGPCWQCGGTDRFLVFTNTGRGWCRQCGWSGDSIQLLRDRDGLTFREACRRLGLSTESLHRDTAHGRALVRAKTDYRAWKMRRFRELVELYRLLQREKDLCVIAYRAIHQSRHLYSEEERRFWMFALADVYDRLPPLEHHLDLFTFREHEETAFRLYTQQNAEGEEDYA